MLLVSPPPFGKFSPFMELFFRGGEATGRGLATAYATVAEACGARFFDAGVFYLPGQSMACIPIGTANGGWAKRSQRQ